MAAILQLEDVDATTVIDLLDVSGFELIDASNSYSLDPSDPLITKNYKFLVKGSSKGAVRTAVTEFIELLQLALKWKDDDLRGNSIWLREIPDSTTDNYDTRNRQLITNWLITINSNQFFNVLQIVNKEVILNWTVTLQRHYENEDTVVFTPTTGFNSTLVGFDKKYIHSSIVLPAGGAASGKGTADGRIRALTLGVTGTAQARFWIGFRKERYGVDNFDPIINWEDGYTVGVADVDKTTTAGSHSTNVVRVRFSSASGNDTLEMKRGVYFAAAGEDYVGEYVALLRYKTITGTGKTFTGRLCTAYYDVSTDTPKAYNPFVFFTDDAKWHFKNMGRIKVPGRGFREATRTLTVPWATLSIGIELASLDGGQGIYLDTITLIPYDHYIAVENASLAGAGNFLYILTHEDNTLEAIQLGSGSFVTGYPVITAQNNWAAPLSDSTVSRLVIAGERSDEQVTTDTLFDATPYIYRRWDYFNG